jgi:asparagine synthase (glutamine-hydrolysing)
MCGIVGKVTAGAPVARELLDAMCEAVRHRGPDAQGVHLDGAVALGMRRLAIIDLVHGDQPIYSEDRTVALVLNGEIYNHLQLREELTRRGHAFAGGSDAEVVVHLWEELGPGCVERLRGMFAFAIWDARSQELFLARDRLGKKPLFFALHDGALSFASEPRAILQDPAIPREVDPVAIDAFLVNQYVPHELCAFRHLRKLPPACTLSWRPGGAPRIERYWTLEYLPKVSLQAEHAAEQLREMILEATQMRLMSDVPIGAFLSGGVDSSIVVAAMAMTSGGTVRTFSVSFDDDRFDETPYARRVASLYGTEHTELECGPPTASLLPRLAWHFGEPFADPAAIPTFQLSELMRDHVTVALNGDGGDESFAGYRRYWQLAATLAADAVPAPAREALARVLRRAAGGADGRATLPRAARLARRLALPPPLRYADLFRYFEETDRARLYTPELRGELAASEPLTHIEAAWDEREGLEAADRLMAVDLDTYLPDDLLAKVDITSMAHSLEVRSPFLDHRLMELAARFPAALKLRGRDGKRVLRDCARAWLPDDLLDRRKHGFAVPVADWLRGELRELPESLLLDPDAVQRGLFRRAEVERLIAEHRAGHNRANKLWAMINLELWYRTCVDTAVASPAALPTLA